MWKGGQHRATGRRNLRQAILERDGNRCLVCGGNGVLEVHHIDGDHCNNRPSNLATLCYNHHRAKGIGADQIFVLNEFIRKVVEGYYNGL